MNTEPFIVKVQIAQFPANKTVLIYNEDNSVFYEQDVTPELVELFSDGSPKKYFVAHWAAGEVENGFYLESDKEVDNPGW